MTGWLWRRTERILASHLPAGRLPAVLGDLAEEYAGQRVAKGSWRAALWLVRETRSLARAYESARHTAPTRQARSLSFDEFTHAWRAVRHRPGNPTLCALLLALGIGLVTAMFSVVDSMMLRPVPFPDPDRLVRQGFGRFEPAVMAAWEASGLFESVEAVSEGAFGLDGAEGLQLTGAFVTPGVFHMLGVSPRFGRTFVGRQPQRGAGDEVIISEGIWRSVFGGDRNLLGQQVRMGERSLTVVGIMPGDFRFPTPATVVWRPLDAAPAQRIVTIYGRLRPGVPRAAVDAPLAAMAAQHATLPANYRGTPPISPVISTSITAPTRQALAVLTGGVMLVFLALTANVVILLLSRLSQRHHEIATCAALGASRSRLLRQIALEHMFIGTIGIALGVTTAWAITAAFPSYFVFGTLNVVDIDARALGAASLCGSLAALGAGLVPAWMASRHDPAAVLRGAEPGRLPTPSRLATHGLLVTQIALAAALLVGTTVLIRSFVNLMTTDRGLSVEGVVRIRVSGMDDGFGTAETMAHGLQAVRRAVAEWPEVRSSALSRELPPLSQGAGGEARAEGLDGYRVSPEFFSIYGIAIVAGRAFEHGVSADEIVLGERLAGQLWPGENPLGRLYRIPGAPARRVVGVAREISLPALDAALDRPEFYLPLNSTSRTLYLSLRCNAACPDPQTINERLRRVHPALSGRLVAAGEDAFAAQLTLPHAIAQVSGTFAVVALLTAACGLFSVLSYIARRRRREFGIRQMLGATPSHLRRLVLGHGLRVLTLGLGMGALLGWAAVRLLDSLLFGVNVLDPLTWAAPLVLLILTALAAMWGPCRMAVCVNPVMLIREE